MRKCGKDEVLLEKKLKTFPGMFISVPILGKKFPRFAPSDTFSEISCVPLKLLSDLIQTENV